MTSFAPNNGEPFAAVCWRSWLAWLERVSVYFEEIPIRVTVRGDPQDDPVVMPAVAA